MPTRADEVIRFEELARTDVALVGGKNASLGEMVRHLGERGVAVPPGFATAARAFWHFIDSNQLRDVIATTLQDFQAGRTPLPEAGQTIRRAILRGDWPKDTAATIGGAYKELSRRVGKTDAAVAVRSSTGGMSDVDFGDLLDYFALDEATSAILIYAEAITHARKFMSAARRAARIKPVIVVKGGRAEQGARAATSHTGALVGADVVYEAAFRRAGMLRVDELEELFDAAATLARMSPQRGNRLAIVTNGGGAGVLATDRLIELGGQLATLGSDTITKLNLVLPPTWSHANPIDLIGDADANRYASAVAALMEDASIDALLVAYCPTAIVSRRPHGDHSCLLTDEQMARAMERQTALLLGGLGRNEPHIGPGRDRRHCRRCCQAT